MQRVIGMRRVQPEDFPARMGQFEMAGARQGFKARVAENLSKITAPTAIHVMVAIQAPGMDAGLVFGRPGIQEVFLRFIFPAGVIDVAEVNEMHFPVFLQRGKDELLHQLGNAGGPLQAASPIPDNHEAGIGRDRERRRGAGQFAEWAGFFPRFGGAERFVAEYQQA